jgi:hypothetical protein
MLPSINLDGMHLWESDTGYRSLTEWIEYAQVITVTGRREGDIIECRRQVNQTGGPALISPTGFSKNLDGILRF